MAQTPLGDAESREPDLDHYRELAEQALDLILELNEQGCIVYASTSHQTRLGYTPAELVGTLAFDYLHPEDVPNTAAIFDHAVHTGVADHALCRVRKADGTWRWFQYQGSPYTNRRGDVRIALVGRDVDDRIRAVDALRSSEALYRTLVETATCGIVESDAQARITFANGGYARMLGVSPDELLGRYIWEFDEEAEASTLQRQVQIARSKQPTPQRTLSRLRAPDGRRLIVEADWNYLRNADGEVTGFVSVIIDVTRREATDVALVDSHRYITQIAETSPTILCVFGIADRSVRYVNSSGVAATGLDIAQLRERGPRILEESVHPDDLSLVEHAVAAALRSRDDEVSDVEHRARHVNGWRWLLSRFAVFSRDEQGKPVEMLVSQLDITDQRMAIDQLRAQEERFRLLAENAGDIILEFDPDGTLLFVSPSWTTITGYPMDGVGTNLSASLRQVLDPSQHAAFEDVGRELFQTVRGVPDGRIVRIRHADGRPLWLEARTRQFTTADGEVRGMAIARDVTDRVRAEEALRASEARFRLVAESLYDFIVEVDPHGEVVYISPSFREILGFDPEDFSHRDALQQIHPADVERVGAEILRLISGEPIGPMAFRQRDAQARWRWLESHGTPRPTADGRFGGVIITRDISERVKAEDDARALQEQLLQSQKLESLGVLAGGIAHDFNNLLVGILGNASLAAADVPAESPLREALEGIETAALRAGELTNQMLAYSGKGRFVIESVDMNALVREMANLLESSISKKASLILDLAPGVPPVEGDASQLRQVVMNLITNASDALGDGAGSLKLRTRAVPNAAEFPMGSRLEEPVAPGPAVLLEVVDTGAGMEPETAKRIFDPFFTTKFTGRGLGLAAALGIVRGHRGAIDVRTGVGSGTCFRILLPAGESCEAPARAPAPHSKPSSEGRLGTVLVADDEEVVLTMARRILERAGFDVLTARDGREAVDVFRRWGSDIACVLLDLTMPRLSGEEALRLLRDVRPDVPVVLTSGYSESEIAVRFEGVALEGFLQKPFRPGDLVDCIRVALEK